MSAPAAESRPVVPRWKKVVAWVNLIVVGVAFLVLFILAWKLGNDVGKPPRRLKK